MPAGVLAFDDAGVGWWWPSRKEPRYEFSDGVVPEPSGDIGGLRGKYSLIPDEGAIYGVRGLHFGLIVKGEGVTGTVTGPGHLGHRRPVFGAGNPRGVGFDERLDHLGREPRPSPRQPGDVAARSNGAT